MLLIKLNESLIEYLNNENIPTYNDINKIPII